jgi:hypothetical protein
MSSRCITTFRLAERWRTSAFIALIASVPFAVIAETRALEALKSEKDLIGVWEAIVQDGSMTSGVYRMEFQRDKSGQLVEVFGTTDGGREKFLGKLTAIEAKDGEIKARFTLVPGHMNYYDWVEVRGTASAEGDGGAILGKIFIHRTGTVLDDWSEPVLFKKGPWLTDLMNASRKAAEIIARSAVIQE